ncbi:MAG: DUF2924 domain-containing protein [Pseudomonadota bacterium]
MVRKRKASDLPDALREIAALDRAACVLRWEAAYGAPPPRYLSAHWMRRVLADELQRRVLGDLPVSCRRRLREAGGTKASAAPARPVTPGTHLVREWQGRTYQVAVEGEGFRFDGTLYRSLTAIAKRITGTQISGPRFFGLKARS